MHFFRFILALLALTAMLRGSPAETIGEITNPKRANNTWVSDMASVLTAQNEQRINKAIDYLERTNGMEMAVVTIRTTDGSTPKQFATRLFNTWGIGKRERNNGVLILLVMEERRIEVETGIGLERILPDEQVSSILQEHVIPHFREDDYNNGVWKGVQALVHVMVRPPSAQPKPVATPPVQAVVPPLHVPATSAAGHTETDATPDAPESSSGNWFKKLIGSLLMLGCGWLFYRSLLRYCPQCKKQMRHLSEQEDDKLLAYEQLFEEQLGSVDYRVWQCDTCHTLTAERNVKWSSGYSACPKCSHVTLASQTTILQHPTYTSTGLSRVTVTCRFPTCKHSAQEHYILPVESPPSTSNSSHSSFGSSSSRSSSGGGGGSSSGSFGGGSSRGGGAGASW